MSRLRKILSVTLHSFAGFFVFIGEMLAFINVPLQKVMLWMIGTPFAIAAILFGLAIAVGKFCRAFEPVGIALLCASGSIAFVAISMLCLLASPEMMQILAQQSTQFPPHVKLSIGAPLTAIIALAGWGLIRR